MLGKVACLLALSLPAVLAGSASSALIQRSPADLRALLSQPQHKWCKGTQVFFPGQPNYANLTTQRWTSYEAPSYVASIKPACVEDIEKVVSIFIEPVSAVKQLPKTHAYSGPTVLCQ